MFPYDFNSQVAIDHVPAQCRCAWCDKPAVYTLTAIGGAYHNLSAYFCASCAQQFVAAVTGAAPVAGMTSEVDDAASRAVVL